MPDAMEGAKESLALCKRAAKMFAGQPSDIVGAALCDLFAMWLAGHHPGLRDELLELNIATIKRLVPPSDSILRARHPEETSIWPKTSA